MFVMEKATTSDGSPGDSKNDLNKSIHDIGIHYTSAQHGLPPLSIPVDPVRLHQQLQDLCRRMEWNTISANRIAHLAEIRNTTGSNEETEFAEWS